MFGILTNLAKATVAVALTPVALITDAVRAPSIAMGESESATEVCIDAIKDNLTKAIKPE